MLANTLWEIVVLALATAAISLTITKGSIFRAFRLWIRVHSRYIGELFRCPYCMSHWVAFWLVGIYHPILVHSWIVVDWCVSVFVVVALAALTNGTIIRLMPFAEDLPDGGIDPAVKQLETALRHAKTKLVEQQTLITQLQKK